MTPKYSTGTDDATRWERDRLYVLAEWSCRPFLAHDRRHDTVENRIAVAYTHEVGVEIRHEARSTDSEKLPDEWETIERIEVRDYGARHERKPQKGLVE